MGTLLAFTMVAISLLIVRYAPNDMPMGGADPSSLESLALHTGHSEADEGILEGPFGNGNEHNYHFCTCFKTLSPVDLIQTSSSEKAKPKNHWRLDDCFTQLNVLYMPNLGSVCGC